MAQYHQWTPNEDAILVLLDFVGMDSPDKSDILKRFVISGHSLYATRRRLYRLSRERMHSGQLGRRMAGMGADRGLMRAVIGFVHDVKFSESTFANA